MATNKNILMLRSWSLRKVIVSYFLATLVAGLLSLNNGIIGLGLTVSVMSFGGMVLYATFAVKAIEKDDKATVTSYIFIVALFMTLLGFFTVLNQTREYTDVTIEDFTIAQSTYTTLMYFIMIVGFLYAQSSVAKKYKGAWWVALLVHVISGFGTLLMFMVGDYETYQSLNNISSVLLVVFMVVLFFVDGKNTEAQTTENTETASGTIPEQPRHTGVTNKGQELLKLKELLDAGILTQEEFDKEKAKILNS